MKKLLLSSLMLFTLQILLAQTIFYFDFGPKDVTNGNNTVNPDENGHYWNNINDPYAINNPTFNLVDESNNSTNLVLKVISNFQFNGINHGSLLSPDPALLGDFAIATATEDYFFTTSNATIEVSGMPSGDSNGYIFSFLEPVKQQIQE